MTETLERTDARRLAVGDPVNLERPLRLADRLGGHLVQGHVDGVGARRGPRAAPRRLDAGSTVAAPPTCSRYVVEKGSITVDGISLTVTAVDGDDGFDVAVIPHTLAVTTLGHKDTGATGQPRGRRPGEVRRATAAHRSSPRRRL